MSVIQNTWRRCASCRVPETASSARGRRGPSVALKQGVAMEFRQGRDISLNKVWTEAATVLSHSPTERYWYAILDFSITLGHLLLETRNSSGDEIHERNVPVFRYPSCV